MLKYFRQISYTETSAGPNKCAIIMLSVENTITTAICSAKYLIPNEANLLNILKLISFIRANIKLKF